MMDLLKHMAKLAAQAVQANAETMTGTELNAEEKFLPDFQKAKEKMNMLKREAGFVCKSSAGRVVFLIQPYDSDVNTGEPEDLPAQWGFKWSDEPAHAKPFVAISTSPYNKGNCCAENDEVFRSLYDNNVHAPSAWPDGWEKVEL